MGLSIAERNRRKRERKKKEKEGQRKEEGVEQQQQQHKEGDGSSTSTNHNNVDSSAGPNDNNDEEIVIEYVAEDPLLIYGISNNKTTVKDSGTSNKKKPSSTSTSTLPDGLPPLPGQDGKSNNNDGEENPEDEEQQQQEEEDRQNDIGDVLRRFQERAGVVLVETSAVVSDDGKDDDDDDDDDEKTDSDNDDEDGKRNVLSKRKLRELIRPSVADLKSRVKRPDLVEAHDVTAADPDFLLALKGIPGTTPVPRHWGRKRKYLQGKRGFEKPPFQLPDFITKTGITEIRDTVADDEAKQSTKQKNRSRVNPKMGSMDVDYKVLHEAFFKYQTKPKGLTGFGDLYYEGKELETSTDIPPGGPYSKKLREALAMHSEYSPPPWLLNMQRFGPPPSYPQLSIPGLNAPLPNQQCQYGFHTGGWGKPPVDAYGRPLYGGNPFDPPGTGKRDDTSTRELVTSDGKTVTKTSWGGLPLGDVYSSGGIGGRGDDSESDDEEEEEESGSDDNDEDMEESDEGGEEGDDEDVATAGMESVLPPPTSTSIVGHLRKQTAGDETPAPQPPPKQLYQVLETKSTSTSLEDGMPAHGGEGVFKSDVQYVVPTGTPMMAAPVPEGAESVLSKAMVPGGSTNKKRKLDGDDDDDAFDKNYKF